MFCKECGKKLEDNAKFCPVCGTAVKESLEQNRTVNVTAESEMKPEVTKAVKQPWWKKIFRYRNYCLIMAVLVVLAFILGNMGKETHSEGRIELYDFMNYTEDDVVQKMGFVKNDWGWYPNENSANIICMDGKVYSLKISEGQEEADMLSLCGMVIGESFSSAKMKLEEDFTPVETVAIDGGTRSIYTDNETGYQLAVDYKNSGEIFGISYVAETLYELEQEADVPQNEEIEIQEDITEEVVLDEEEVTEDLGGAEEVIPEEPVIEEQLTAEERMAQMDGALNTMVFTYWDDYRTERILIDFSLDIEGAIIFYAEYYDDSYNLISDEVVEARYILDESEDKYYLYSVDGDYLDMYFMITYEECLVLNIFDEISGEEMGYLEEVYARSNVG